MLKKLKTYLEMKYLYLKESKFFDVQLSSLTDPINLFEWLSINSGGFPEPYTFGKRLK